MNSNGLEGKRIMIASLSVTVKDAAFEQNAHEAKGIVVVPSETNDRDEHRA
jgi:hypothetical protein